MRGCGCVTQFSLNNTVNLALCFMNYPLTLVASVTEPPRHCRVTNLKIRDFSTHTENTAVSNVTTQWPKYKFPSSS